MKIDWGKVKCFFGFHDGKLISRAKCKALLGSIIGDSSYKVDAVAEIRKCSRCSKFLGVVTDGIHETTIDPDILVSLSNGILHL